MHDPAHSVPAAEDFDAYAESALAGISDDDLFREEWARLAHETPAWVVWAWLELQTERLDAGDWMEADAFENEEAAPSVVRVAA